MAPIPRINLSKDDQQKVVLTVLMVVFLTVACSYLLFGPGWKRLENLRKELAEVKGKVGEAREMIQDQARIQRVAREGAIKFDQLRQWIPDETNSSWVLKLVSDLARTQQIHTVAIKPMPTQEGEPEETGFFKTATCQIQLKTDYHSLGKFVDWIEAKSPYYTVKEISVESSLNDPSRHEINFKLQYLTSGPSKTTNPAAPK